MDGVITSYILSELISLKTIYLMGAKFRIKNGQIEHLDSFLFPIPVEWGDKHDFDHITLSANCRYISKTAISISPS